MNSYQDRLISEQTNPQNAVGLKTAESAQFIYGFKKEIIFILSKLHILWIGLVAYRNPFNAFRALKKLMALRKQVNGKLPIPRYIKSSHLYYWSTLAPGWPSVEFRLFIENELDRIHPYKPTNGYLQTMIFAITNKCNLRCEHCFEWDNLNSKELLSLQDLQTIMNKFQSRGINQIQLSGGEPLARFDDLIELIGTAQPGTDFWLLTSGLGLTEEKARDLKEAGLTGVNISLDHWEEHKHNQFRNNEKSFYWVREAAANCRNADLLVCFSICAVKELITRENLFNYLRQAKAFGAGFIQILEPRKVGHFVDKDVELDVSHKNILEEFYLKINSDPAYRNMPTVMYPGYHQRMLGCFGAGNRYLYVDPKGDIHACPFCQTAVGNALSGMLKDEIPRLNRVGCHKFETLRNDLN